MANIATSPAPTQPKCDNTRVLMDQREAAARDRAIEALEEFKLAESKLKDALEVLVEFAPLTK